MEGRCMTGMSLRRSVNICKTNYEKATSDNERRIALENGLGAEKILGEHDQKCKQCTVARGY